MKTIMVNPKSVTRKWKLVDAAEKPMGRVASEVARLLMGKHKAIYSPNVDTGDHVIVINTDKVILKDDNFKYVVFDYEVIFYDFEIFMI